MKAAWRCLLPPLAGFAEAASLDCLRLDARGVLLERCQLSLGELAQRRQGLPVELYLHPRDCRLAALELPALPAAKLAAAVNCAAEALVLGDPAQLRLAHGPRGADGGLTLGWLEASALAPLEQALQRLRLDVRQVQAAPFLLPLREDGWVAGEWDGHLLLRRSLTDAAVHPLPEQGLDELPEDLRLHWLGERPTWNCATLARTEALDEALRWSGPACPWGLALKQPMAGAGRGTWKLPLTCAALALLVWVAGLNLYAGQLAGQGQALQRQGIQRVQQAFPELPVVLDPLRQARERRDAYLAGKADGDAAPGLAALLHGTGEAMPFLAGRLQRLDYRDGELDLALLPGPAITDAATWQGELGKHGLQADASDRGWQVRAAETPLAPGTADGGETGVAGDE
ncbi:type II secretion system protein GspL [Pseudomonas paraeruginosa]|uniref:type II secretion system protein GspL n=1 Tax=Pseudomonas paraeruginosa TaxID=2994495 RepID=UPI00053D962E|nr:type II secretion system protein GspL [Pseudomonas paraeruginosa]